MIHKHVFSTGRGRYTAYCLVVTAGLTHLTALIEGRHQVELSNLIQFGVALLVVAICLCRVKQASESYFRSAWIQLAVGFGIYAAAQGYFAWIVILRQTTPHFPSLADVLWMMFAFPILLVTVMRPSGSRWQWVDWLDAIQACIFFSLLYVLVFSHAAAISVSLAYELQSAALVLAWTIRFSSTRVGPERTFFRDLGRFLFIYGVLSSLGNRWEQYGLPAHGWVGLCWSVPLLSFCLFALRKDEQPVGADCNLQPQAFALPTHLHGLSAFGLSVMSISAAAVLALHRSGAGITLLAFVFTIFAVRTCLREAQLHQAHVELEHAVMHDSLTGLANRAWLMCELNRVLQYPSTVRRTALLFIDLDRFKFINDSLGHAVGDLLLAEVARVLRANVRARDTVVRLGGDEFVVLLDAVGPKDVEAVADGFVKRFREPVIVKGRSLHVSVSVGYVMHKAGISPDDLLRDADCAMYVAKKKGKNRAQVFDDGVLQRAEKALRLETDLRRALASGELDVHYQPIYSISGNRIEGFEALVRWQHSTRGLVAPAEFISVAEETGLIVELGEQVLRQACIQVAHWNHELKRSFTVSVNVSAQQFAEPELLHRIQQVLLDTAFPPALLTLEITESVLLNGAYAVTDVLEAARAFGIRISLDDFLTGYSSLSYLLHYPCDLVKIDKSLVQGLNTDARRTELVRTVVQLAKAFDKEVIAEGVETTQELQLLTVMGCGLIQGHVISKPLPARLMHTVLENEPTTLFGSLHHESERALSQKLSLRSARVTCSKRQQDCHEHWTRASSGTPA